MTQKEHTNFIEEIITKDIETNKNDGRLHTRFPPEPNGYLHIGHAKAICLNFTLAEKYNGKCNLRFDDTNPTKEEEEYVQSIQEDVKWLGFDWGDRLFFASDYFDKLYAFAIELINKGKAYVCDLSATDIREYRGTLTEPGKDSPYRARSIEENLALFEQMKHGEFEDGTRVLRAKIDMSSPNLNMRDPVIYRIAKEHHHRTKDKWCIYPMYDFTHGLSDALEGITHSICTLEFENHRPLYDWFLAQLDVSAYPRQIEFARLNLSYTVLSKRKLQQLVDEKIVSGWDDPLMPTISGLRRRGYTPEAIRNFCERIGVAKMVSIVDLALLEYFVREDLNKRARRVMSVIDPLKVVIENYPDDKVEEFDAENNPEDESAGMRKVQFSKIIYIEREDFMENAPKKYFRLSPGKEVRLKYAYYITCTEIIKDKNGEIIELRCRYDEQSRGGWTEDGRKVRGTLHWVSEQNMIKGEVRLYDTLFKDKNPSSRKKSKVDIKTLINEKAVTVKQAFLEPCLATAKAGDKFQFLRKGYFCLDKESTSEKLIFNRTVTLKDSYKITG